MYRAHPWSVETWREAGSFPAVLRVAAGTAETEHRAEVQELPTELEEKPCDLHRPFLRVFVGYGGRAFTCSRIWGGSSPFSLQNL